MGLFDGLGRIVRDAVHGAEAAVKNAERTVVQDVARIESQVAPLLPKLKYFADQFQTVVQHGIGDVVFHPQPDNAEPQVYGDDPHVTYQKVDLPLYANGVPDPNDVFQGGIGDCNFMAAMAATAASSPESIMNAIHDNGDGTYTVTLYEPKGLGVLRRLGFVGVQAEELGYDAFGGLMNRIPLEPVRVTVTGKVPEQQGTAVYASPRTALWPCILEKAFAKVWGNYSAMGVGSYESVPLMGLTGKPVQFIHLDTGTRVDGVWRLLKTAMANREPVTAGSQILDSTKDHVVGMHAYSVVAVFERDGQRYVTLRNPWGSNPSGGALDTADNGDLTLTVTQLVRDFDHLCVAAGTSSG